MTKPYAESCDQNKQPILEAIGPYLKDRKHLLEIGSGTGQHAIFFAAQFPDLIWQTSDQSMYHPGIHMWLKDAALPNTRDPLKLNVSQTWPEIAGVDAVYSANTTHIMSWQNVCDFFAGVGSILDSEGVFILYGPFNYNGQYTSDSNAAFDERLKERDPLSGIRDFEELNKLASEAGMQLENDIEMPANNRTLVWRKT